VSTNPDTKPPDGDSSGTGARVADGSPAAHEISSGAESWVALCAQAAVEQDPKRLLELVKEINRLLGARRQRLSNEVDNKPEAPREPEDGNLHGKAREPK
jgi:hypothetical protein